MAEEAVVGKTIDLVVESVGPVIKRQFNYLCCFTSNINDLKNEAKKLDDAAAEIQGRVNRALDNAENILPAVKTLLDEDYKGIKDEKTTILDQVPNVGNVCLNLGARFSLSRTAVKTTERIKKLQEECNQYSNSSGKAISEPRPPPAREAVELGNAYAFESRKEIEEKIMIVLRDRDVSLIGIYGMGGLGKTTIARMIKYRVLKEEVLKEAVFAIVSGQVDKLNIQLEIGGQLGLDIDEKTPRAVIEQKLRARLTNTDTGRTLLVLDDVWQKIELEEFGIPCHSKGCTILITSRDTHLLDRMGVQKKFGMELLSDKDARILFEKKVGICMDDAELKSIAEGIVKKCGGLPIALATVGAALKDKSPNYWSNALNELSRHVPHHIADYMKNVYNPLRLSYDSLNSQLDESIFLLCCLFPEDAYIDVEKLTYFGMGLDIFEDILDLEDVRNAMTASITTLRDRSLLLDSEEGDDYVRMHDVIHDICKIIATEKKYIGTNDCQWISSFEMVGGRTGLGSQNLRLLFLDSWYSSKEEEALKLDTAFSAGIGYLSVLWIERNKSLTSLSLMHSLKSLVLDSCKRLKTLSVVGNLVNLKILICRNCPLIEELPLDIKRSHRLKLLDLTWCQNLKRIGHGIISSLLELEELKMLNSFKRWESEYCKKRENAGIRELEPLTKLRCLEIEIEDSALAAEMMNLSSNIKRFHIIIGATYFSLLKFYHESSMKKMALELKSEGSCLGNSIEMQLLRDTEYLCLSGNGANRVNLAKCKNVRWLESLCETMKNIITTSMVDEGTPVLASLEQLALSFLPKLEAICDGPISSNSFHNLKRLRLSDLDALKQLWKSNIPLLTNLSSIDIRLCESLCNLGQLSMVGKDCLPQLQELVIIGCEMMEQVFLWNKEETIVFPKLKEVYLNGLPNLATFYQGMGGIEFPLLTNLTIVSCPKLKSMGTNDNSGDIDDHSLQQLFCQPKKVSFTNLNKVFLLKLHGTMSLFSSSVAGSLVNLQSLHIQECNEMIKVIKCDEMLKVIEDNKEVIEDENVVPSGNNSESQSYRCITKVFSKLKKVIKCNKEEDEKVVSGTVEMPLIQFPKLEELQLEDLPKLVTFCEWKCDVKLPSLRNLIIKRCTDMENLSLGFLVAPNLKDFKTDLKNNLGIGADVSFDSLKELVIKESEKPLYSHKLFISICNGLKELEVSGSMSCLLTSSIARRLGNLEGLSLQFCFGMVKVIEDEDENEEKVGSAGERTLLFPKLNTLKLMYLSKLVSFCEWKCDVEFPSLRDVVVVECPVLRSFTMGSKAAAPNLENVRIEREDIDSGTKDMNSVVQQYLAGSYVKKQEEMKKMKGREEVEKEEIKGELEEEGQN